MGFVAAELGQGVWLDVLAGLGVALPNPREGDDGGFDNVLSVVKTVGFNKSRVYADKPGVDGADNDAALPVVGVLVVGHLEEVAAKAGDVVGEALQRHGDALLIPDSSNELLESHSSRLHPVATGPDVEDGLGLYEQSGLAAYGRGDDIRGEHRRGGLVGPDVTTDDLDVGVPRLPAPLVTPRLGLFVKAIKTAEYFVRVEGKAI